MTTASGESSGPSLVRFPFKAIAAMAVNRVIGVGNKLPWHFPEDFKWFKRTTTGHVVVMGRKTYESIGRPLPNRTTIVLSRSDAPIAGVVVAHSLSEIDVSQPPLAGREVFICGGAQVYEMALPLCSDLFLTLVKKSVEGDAYFPPFEDAFTLANTVLQTPDFDILHYRRRP